MTSLEGSFIAALDDGPPDAAVGALLELDAVISARVRAGEDSPDLDNASATFRSLVVRLGERAAAGPADPEDRAGAPGRRPARGPRCGPCRRDWATADLIRDRLAAAGIEVRDGAAGSTWTLDGPVAGALLERPAAQVAASSAAIVGSASFGYRDRRHRPLR